MNRSKVLGEAFDRFVDERDLDEDVAFWSAEDRAAFAVVLDSIVA